MSNGFTADENVVFSLTTKQNQALADLPGGASSLSVGSLFVIREGSAINLADTGVTFSELSADDDGQYLATLDRTALTTKDGNPFVQQAGDGFVFSYRAEIFPGQFVGASDNLFASIRSDLDIEEIQTRLDAQDARLEEIKNLLPQTIEPVDGQPFHSGLVVTGPVGYEAPETDRYFQCVTPLGYTDYRSIEDLYGHLGLENILNDNDQEVEPNGLTHYENVVNAAIVDAEQTISLRLSPWFTKEQLVGDQWIWSRTRWIAAYYLSQRRGNEHYFEAKYHEVMRELDAIATGEIAPPSCIPLRANSLPSMSNLEIDDSFFLHKTRVQSTISVGGTYPGQDINYYYGFFFGAI